MYRIAYGLETETIEAQNSMVLLDLPDEFDELDTGDLEFQVRENGIESRELRMPPAPFTYQDMVGFNDIVESFELAMQAEGLGPGEISRI